MKVGMIAAATVILSCHSASAQVGKSDALLYPNQATNEELAALPGLNDGLAQKIIDQRPYTDMVQLDKLLAEELNEEERKSLYTKLFEPLNLNNATEEEILLIPGVGDRMAHEFLEYRPYENMARFRREIGKYVDDEEVARLEQFVFVPLDLNTASEEDLLTIPGVGPRMLEEFLEYRPYNSIEKFRREIGKYVDEKEVARLERYVTLKK